MMKLKPFSKSLAGAVLKILPFVLFLSACSSSTSPSFLKEDIAQAVKDISKKEYNLDIVTRLVGNTLWAYMPLEDILTKPAKPEKYIERFLLEERENSLQEKILKVSYLIRPTVENEKHQEMEINKASREKIFNLLRVISRVLMSTKLSKEEKPVFFCIVTADIKNGIEIKQTFHLLDFKKLSYNIISQTEYQHRIVQDTGVSLQVVGDKEGSHLNYYEITLEEFIADQIQGRIRLKFQKPEVESNADIDKEVLKIITYTLSTYGFKDFTLVELMNEATGKKVILNQTAIFANPKE
ncbi:MAG: hypothetical protein WC574_03990 [Candidatus Omnitrophota bacterium]